MKLEGSDSNSTYKSVVSEVELDQDENFCLAVFNKLFVKGRKLKPVVQKK